MIFYACCKQSPRLTQSVYWQRLQVYRSLFETCHEFLVLEECHIVGQSTIKDKMFIIYNSSSRTSLAMNIKQSCWFQVYSVAWVQKSCGSTRMTKVIQLSFVTFDFHSNYFMNIDLWFWYRSALARFWFENKKSDHGVSQSSTLLAIQSTFM